MTPETYPCQHRRLSVRTGQGCTRLTRGEFGRRYGRQFYDPAFDGGWPYPSHLAGRIFPVIVHGDTDGRDVVRQVLHDWLTGVEQVPARRSGEPPEGG